MIKLHEELNGDRQLFINKEFIKYLSDYGEMSSRELESLIRNASYLIDIIWGFCPENSDGLYDSIVDLRKNSDKYVTLLNHIQYIVVKYYKEHFPDKFKFTEEED